MAAGFGGSARAQSGRARGQTLRVGPNAGCSEGARDVHKAGTMQNARLCVKHRLRPEGSSAADEEVSTKGNEVPV